MQLFRTARDKLLQTDVPDFKIRLFSNLGSVQHELPTTDQVGAIIFDSGPESVTDFDVIIERHSGDPERVNKLQPTYMSLHFPLLFIFGEHGYHTELKLAPAREGSSEGSKRMSMDAYYAYLLHDRFNRYTLLTRGGRLFQQFVVTAYCSVEQSRTDYIRQHQADIRGEYLTGVYDAIARGDHQGSDVGSRIILWKTRRGVE